MPMTSEADAHTAQPTLQGRNSVVTRDRPRIGGAIAPRVQSEE
jgi:hypothetical protein